MFIIEIGSKVFGLEITPQHLIYNAERMPIEILHFIEFFDSISRFFQIAYIKRTKTSAK